MKDDLVDRLRGQYSVGPHLPNGKPEFGYRQFESPPIQHEAADYIDMLRAQLRQAGETAESHHEKMRALYDGAMRELITVKRRNDELEAINISRMRRIEELRRLMKEQA